jgi:hypothetical protein
VAVALTAAFLLPAPTYAAAQSGDASIVGQITSQVTDEPVSGAAVLLRGTEHEAVTTEDGIFAMEDLPAGDHELVVRYMDMESRVFPVRLERRQPLTVDFTVNMQVIPVASLEVTVEQTPPRGKLHDFYRRAANGPGYFITREDIEDRPISRPTDILRRVPGLDIGARRSGRTPVTMGRRDGCVPDFYLDGARAPFFNIDNLEPMDIAGIEIYRGNSEVPIRFKHRDRCGVIVIWTRDPSNVHSFD